MGHQNWEPRYATRAEGMQASEIRELLKVMDQPGVISFAGGIPDPALFPLAEVRSAYEAALTGDEGAGKVLQYSISEGDPALRRWIAAHMAAKGVPCSAENILITNGSQQALEFIGKLFLSPRDTALVMAPTYLGALQAFSAYEPVYDELKLAHTNRTAESYRENAAAAGGSAKFVYTVPDFANPTGETLDLAARERLLELAAELDMPVIEDAAYTALRFEGEEVAPLQALDVAARGSIDASRVLYCGTFSKVFMPGLRVGWVCASRAIIEKLVLIKQASDLNSSAVNQSVVRFLAERMFDEQVARARTSYREKRDAMLAALRKHMPKGVEWSEPQGGLFVWLTLDASIDTAALLQRSVAEVRVAFVPGHAFFANGKGRNTMRLSYSLPDAEAIDRGIASLASLIRAG
ncbi:PLP-dependent aminotransferase family protein [Rhodobacteraceae bacterium NNCM2]|nr:PLP-dependent aminotransferase family protein [Coraliihabitans acroporae]